MNALHQSYADAFLSGIADYAHMTAAMGTEVEEEFYITLSQRLDIGSSPLIVALAASVDAFYALASGYSGVSLDGMEELAVDAVSEFFNVVNGHFSSRMREDGVAVSIIDPPRHYHGAAAPNTTEFSYFITSPAGGMRLMAAQEEFLPAQAH